jgi:hypothetical protein
MNFETDLSKKYDTMCQISVVVINTEAVFLSLSVVVMQTEKNNPSMRNDFRV